MGKPISIWLRKSPRGRELRIKKDGAGHAHFAQNLGKRVHRSIISQHPQIPKHLQRIMAFRQRFEFLHRVLWLLQMRKERVPMNRLVNQAKAAAFEKRLVAVLNYRSRGPRL